MPFVLLITSERINLRAKSERIIFITIYVQQTEDMVVLKGQRENISKINRIVI
jgi:hypothetical protein